MLYVYSLTAGSVPKLCKVQVTSPKNINMTLYSVYQEDLVLLVAY